MRIVAALLLAKVRTIVIVGAILGAKALLRGPGLDQCAVYGEVFVGHELLRLLVHLGEESAATSEVSNRSRFLQNTAWFHTASSMPRPTNQRNSRL